MDKIDYALENQDLHLQWLEIAKGFENGEAVEVTMINRATVRDCIRMQHLRHSEHKRGNVLATDEQLLVEFMSVHWADLVKE